MSLYHLWYNLQLILCIKNKGLLNSAEFNRQTNQAFNSSSECLISVVNVKKYLKCLTLCALDQTCEMAQFRSDCKLYSCIKRDIVFAKDSFIFAKIHFPNSTASSVSYMSSTSSIKVTSSSQLSTSLITTTTCKYSSFFIRKNAFYCILKF